MNTQWQKFIETQHFSTDLRELQSVFQDNYICDLGNFSIIQIKGIHAANFLQGQLTCDINRLNEKNAFPGAVCDHKGRMVANFWIWRQGNEFYLLLPDNQSTAIIQHLNKYAVFSKVTLSLFTEWCCFAGGGHKFENSVKPLADVTHTQFMQILGACTPRYILVGEFAKLENLWNYLALTLAHFNETAFKFTNIQAGWVFIYQETANLLIPQMINLEKFHGVSFEKGCYVGQEIIARTQHLGILKRHLQCCSLPIAHCPAIGTRLKNSDDEEVGILVEAGMSQYGCLVLAVIQDRAMNQNLFCNAEKLEHRLTPM